MRMPKLGVVSLIYVTIVLLVIFCAPFDHTFRKMLDSSTSFKGSFSESSGAEGEIGSGKIKGKLEKYCDLFSGEWIPNPEGPYYTNETCLNMHEYQNCMKHGKPDTGYLKWRWKPDGCELPIFDPKLFLELIRGKSIAFVGDSMARNQMQSLGCLLSRVAVPDEDSSPDGHDSQDWVYKDDNFNMSMFWSPYLIRTETPEGKPVNLYLDEFDEFWTSKIERYHYIIISAGQWFLRASNYYENGRLVGCHGCKNETESHFYTAYQKAFRTALRAINSLRKPPGLIFLRTISPSHFEEGDWGNGGDCVRTRPFKRDEIVLQDYYSMLREIQLKELKTAEEEGSKNKLRFRLLDITESMLLRPDGHPSKYGHWSTEKGPNDCLHWCLPGPVDIWNDLLLQLLIREAT